MCVLSLRLVLIHISISCKQILERATECSSFNSMLDVSSAAVRIESSWVGILLMVMRIWRELVAGVRRLIENLIPVMIDGAVLWH